MNEKPAAKSNNVLKVILIGGALFLVLAGIGTAFVVSSLGKFFSEASAEIEADMHKSEVELQSMPAAELKQLSLAELIEELQKDAASTGQTYDGQYLSLTGKVNQSAALAKSEIPIQLPADVLLIESDVKQTETVILGCLYSKSQKSTMAPLKAGQAIAVRGKLEIDEEGDLFLSPCALEP
ncbi:MAG: hypothetical protein CVV27_09295 [Candidatus Melainabacteria bacterium HGW-Melainabacteria-1]|nr:MAG: hypothetical protein CVV27_09295 [Candidatus Melainabacteria bacterium HGW-Melainabacteria-1]